MTKIGLMGLISEKNMLVFLRLRERETREGRYTINRFCCRKLEFSD
jgi:hypothetical protein